MARDFDGANDNIDFGADASISEWSPISYCGWWQFDATGVRVLYARGANGRNVFIRGVGAGHVLRWEEYGWSGGTYAWDGTTAISGTGRIHIAGTYDPSSTSNDPTLYLNGVAESFTLNPTPAGTFSDVESQNLTVGTDSALGGDVDGRLACFVGAQAVLSAAEINRAMWWGRPRGGLEIYHPCWTDKLNNEGSATANGTASGTTVAPLAIPTVRPGSALLGGGVGW